MPGVRRDQIGAVQRLLHRLTAASKVAVAVVRPRDSPPGRRLIERPFHSVRLLLRFREVVQLGGDIAEKRDDAAKALDEFSRRGLLRRVAAPLGSTFGDEFPEYFPWLPRHSGGGDNLGEARQRVVILTGLRLSARQIAPRRGSRLRVVDPPDGLLGTGKVVSRTVHVEDREDALTRGLCTCSRVFGSTVGSPLSDWAKRIAASTLPVCAR